MGAANASVLPVPVSAHATTSPPASASGMTAPCTERVPSKPRSVRPCISRLSRCSALNGIGAASASTVSHGMSGPSVDASMTAGACARAGRLRRKCEPGRRDERAGMDAGELKGVLLSSAERDDSALGIVGRDANRDAIAGDDLDAKPPHPPAQLRQHLMAGVHLHAVKTPAVDGHHRALHVYEIVFTH